MKNKKIFLKRCAVPGISLKDLYLGNDINIYSRLHKLMEYGDDYTKNYFEEIRSNSFGLIKPDAYLNIGKIIDCIYQNGFNITRLKLTNPNCNVPVKPASPMAVFYDTCPYLKSYQRVGMLSCKLLYRLLCKNPHFRNCSAAKI